jgi:LmbE family N-acetylglucosaminyl deacetylase
MAVENTALVISAHAADFVWRCGGAIALHQQPGCEVTVACLSFGERGESAKLWKQGGKTLEAVKDARRSEAQVAAVVSKKSAFWIWVTIHCGWTAMLRTRWSKSFVRCSPSG